MEPFYGESFTLLQHIHDHACCFILVQIWFVVLSALLGYYKYNGSSTHQPAPHELDRAITGVGILAGLIIEGNAFRSRQTDNATLRQRESREGSSDNGNAYILPRRWVCNVLV